MCDTETRVSVHLYRRRKCKNKITNLTSLDCLDAGLVSLGRIKGLAKKWLGFLNSAKIPKCPCFAINFSFLCFGYSLKF